jgi:hypothetical protein
MRKATLRILAEGLGDGGQLGVLAWVRYNSKR